MKESGEAQNELSESDGTESSPADEIASTFQDWDGTNLVQTTVTDVTEVVKAVMPSVVSVNNKYVETTSFWGQEFSSEGSSTGSGIIVGKNDTEPLSDKPP